MERRGGGRRDRRRSRSRSRFEQMISCLCPLLTFSSIQTYPPSLLHRKSRRRAAAAPAPLLLYNVKKKLKSIIFQGKEEQEQGQEWPLLNWKAGRRRRRRFLGVFEETSERGFVTESRCKCVRLFINNGLIVRRLNWYTPM